MFNQHTSAMADRIIKLLPMLRTRAVELVGEQPAADELVERTLVRALKEVASYEDQGYIEDWLFSLMAAEWEASRPRS